MSDIAINPVTRRVQFTGNTGTGPYAFTFNILVDGDIAVFKGTTELTLTTDYTVSINANGTGSITLVVALITSDVLTIIGGRELSRTTDFVTAGDLLASSLNEQLDSNVIMTQQLDEKLGRGLFVNPGDVFTDLELPLKDARKGTVLGFNATSGDPEPGPEIADVDSLASISADIKTLAEIQDGTVATDAITNVNTIRANVTTVSGISGNVTTVAGISSDVTTVAADGSDIGTVAGISSDVTTVAGISANVTSVAGNETNINTVAADGTDIGTVATSIANVNTVATDIANVNTNATNIASINTNATNISDIQDASANAASALASKNAAATSATNSANSATASETSKVASVAAQAAAETAETNAETAQTAAETAETNAAASETAAGTSETNAATSAATATTQAGIATTKAGEAATSATASATSASASEAAKDAALAALDNFDDRYLGQKATDPTVDNDGDPLVSGALYFNTTDDVMKVYDGSSWLAAYASLSGALLVANNLSDLASASSGRTNLGLGTVATTAATDYATAAQGTLADSAVQLNDSPTFAGLATTADVTFGDNDKAIFGAGSDLQIYHDGSNSYITDEGTGSLLIGAENFYLRSPVGAAEEYMIRAIKDAQVDLYYNNSLKLATTSTGVDISGSITADGLTVDDGGSNTNIRLQNTNSGSGSTDGFLIQHATNAHTYVWNYENADTVFGTNATERMRIDSSGNVGIGTSSPAYKFHQHESSSSENYHLFTNSTTGSTSSDGFRIGIDSNENALIWHRENNSVQFATNNTERMRLDASGNLLVGKTSSSGSTQGAQLQAAGNVFATASNDYPLYLNRLGSDGQLAQFRKDGVQVGSIRALSGDLTIDGPSEHTGLRFEAYDITPRHNGSASNGVNDLGTSGAKFKDGHFSGTVNAANFNTTSDATLKTNVETLTGSLDAVKSLRGVSFDWIENGNSEVGVIAQEVEAVLPDVVSTNDEGIKSVKYGNMVALLIEAMKEQQAQIDELKAQLGE